MVPVTIVACQSRSFQGKHGSGQTLADGRQKPAKARSFLSSGTGAAQVFINHHYLAKTELFRTARQRILQFLALQVIAYLVGRRLTHVNGGSSLELVVLNLLSHFASFRSS